MMNPVTSDERARLKKRLTEEAIKAAVASQWRDALEKNQALLEIDPGNADAWNRLGKALMELGRYSEAREAYGKALSLDPTNSIARKNLARMEGLEDTPQEELPASSRIDLNLFVEETGKTGFATLSEPAEVHVLAALTPGDQIELKPHGGGLAAIAMDGTHLGLLEPRMGLRLRKLIEGGNRYIAAIQSVGEGVVRIVIREVYQHPSQSGRLSFPAKTEDAFRAYTKDSMVRYEDDDDDEEDDEDDEYGGDWDDRKSALDDDSDGDLGVDDDVKDDDE